MSEQPTIIERLRLQAYVCAHGHAWFMASDQPTPRRCPVCGTITFVKGITARAVIESRA